MKWLMHLYPRAWRKRYGREFDALLEDVRPDRRTTFDLLQGAIHMQFTTWTFRKTVAACGIAGIVIAAIVGFNVPSQYVSESSIQYDGGTKSRMEMSDDLARAQNHLRSRGTLSLMIRDMDLYHTELRSKPLENVIERMNQDLAVSTRTATTGVAFTTTFKYPDSGVAQKVTSRIASRLAESLQGATIVTPATRSTAPVSPNWTTMLIIGLLGGLSTGFVIAKLVFRGQMITLAGSQLS